MKKFMLAFLILAIIFWNLPVVNAMSWGYKRSENEVPAEAGAEFDELLEKYNAIYKGDPDTKDVYLTFDNSYENGLTESVLDVLRDNNVPATFFVTGRYLKNAPSTAMRMVAEGHNIGIHTWGHLNYKRISKKKMKSDLDKISKDISKITGQQDVKYLRTLRGTFTKESLQYTQELGYQNVFWSMAFVDWYTKHRRGEKFAYDTMMEQLHPGAIIMLHSVSKNNAEALQQFIKDTKAKGYSFKSLDMIDKNNVNDEIDIMELNNN